jgi:RNA polymerase sigma factor (TIGR02999 family)
MFSVVFFGSFMAPDCDRSGEITVLLHRWREGDTEAENHLFEIVEPNLRKLAHYLMKREWRERQLDATELVSEAYVKLLAAKDRDWQNRKHFFALAATIMRRHLIDLARRSEPTSLPADFIDAEMATATPEEAVILSELLDQLAKAHPDWCMVVEMKHFLGLTDDDIARELAIPLRTVQRTWHDARKWLFDRRNRKN